MKLILKKFSKVPNAGDMFSIEVMKNYFNKSFLVDDCEYGKGNNNLNLILVGSIIHWSNSKTIICGGGLISRDIFPNEKPLHICAVRGPETYSRLMELGIKSPKIFGDPGVLAGEIYGHNVPIISEIGVIPHYMDLNNPWVKKCEKFGIKIIDPTSNLKFFIDQLKSVEIVISSSLHGIIFAHSFGKRALWIELSKLVIGDGFKFYDYYRSLGLKLKDVKRYQINGDENPYNLIKHAFFLPQDDLKDSIKSALIVANTHLENNSIE